MSKLYTLFTTLMNQKNDADYVFIFCDSVTHKTFFFSSFLHNLLSFAVLHAIHGITNNRSGFQVIHQIPVIIVGNSKARC